MRFEAKVSNPDDIEVQLTVTMKLRDWNFIHRDLANNSVPAMKFRNEIFDLLQDVHKSFYGTTLPDEDSNG